MSISSLPQHDVCPPEWYEFQLKGKSKWDDLVESSELIVLKGNGFNFSVENLYP